MGYIQGRINTNNDLKIQGVGDETQNRSYGVSAVEEIGGGFADAIEESAPFNQTSVRTDKPYTLLSVQERTHGGYQLVENMSDTFVTVTDENLEAFIEENEDDLRAAGAFVEKTFAEESTESAPSSVTVQGRINADNNLKLQGIGDATINRDYGVSDVMKVMGYVAEKIEDNEPFASTSEATCKDYTELEVTSTSTGYELTAPVTDMTLVVPSESDLHAFLEANDVEDGADETIDELAPPFLGGEDADSSTNGESDQPLDALAEETLRTVLTSDEVDTGVKVAAALDVLENA